MPIFKNTYLEQKCNKNVTKMYFTVKVRFLLLQWHQEDIPANIQGGAWWHHWYVIR